LPPFNFSARKNGIFSDAKRFLSTVDICYLEGPADKLFFAAQCLKDKYVYPQMISPVFRVEPLVDLKLFLSTLKINCQRENL
jgi:hypothetical protein